jgi:hypothetical protein
MVVGLGLAPHLFMFCSMLSPPGFSLARFYPPPARVHTNSLPQQQLH